MVAAASKGKQARMCFFIPADGRVEGHGFRVSIVTENEPGHSPTGTWPYEGKSGQKMPWFWGDDYEEACRTADEMNEKKFGLTKADVFQIVVSSMRAGHAGTRARR